jgi:hypothetical protein
MRRYLEALGLLYMLLVWPALLPLLLILFIIAV